MRFSRIETIECGEKTCASEPGVFCDHLRTIKFGQQPICNRFTEVGTRGDGPTRLRDVDGWVIRCDMCTHTFCQ
jgi:hypothetical protein